jgi:hypothetical protein
MIDDYDCRAIGAMNEWQGKPKYTEKTCPSTALATTDTKLDLSWSRTQAAAVGSRWLTVWDDAWLATDTRRPCYIVFIVAYCVRHDVKVEYIPLLVQFMDLVTCKLVLFLKLQLSLKLTAIFYVLQAFAFNVVSYLHVLVWTDYWLARIERSFGRGLCVTREKCGKEQHRLHSGKEERWRIDIWVLD